MTLTSTGSIFRNDITQEFEMLLKDGETLKIPFETMENFVCGLLVVGEANGVISRSRLSGLLTLLLEEDTFELLHSSSSLDQEI